MWGWFGRPRRRQGRHRVGRPGTYRYRRAGYVDLRGAEPGPYSALAALINGLPAAESAAVEALAPLGPVEVLEVREPQASPPL